MHVSWGFLDKRAATIQVICSYSRMKFIVEHSDEEVLEKEAVLVGLGAVKLDGLPTGNNDRAGEDRVISAINSLDLIKERRRQAEEYMAWFKPAWEELSEDDRFILETFYVDPVADPIDVVCRRFHVQRNSAYKKKNRALQHLTVMLYGIF